MKIYRFLSRDTKRSVLHIAAAIFLGVCSIASAQNGNGKTLEHKRAKPELVDTIAAVVNTEVITRADLERRTAMVMRNMKSKKQALPEKAKLQKQILEHMILERAQLQKAKERGIRVDDRALDSAIANIAEQNKLSVSDFRRRVERDGTPYPLFREQLRNEIAIRRLKEKEVASQIQIGDSEIENFLAEYGMSLDQQEFHLGHILVRIPENASAEQMESSRQRAELVMKKLREGASFSQVAVGYSDGENALEGGDMGWRMRERLPQVFSEAVAKMKINEVAAPIKTANGYHILKLFGRRSSKADKPMPLPTAVQQTHARHILIKVNKIVSAEDARRKLEDIKQRIENGTGTFEEFAKLYSNDLSANKGGDLGWIYPGDTVPDFERAMNALKVGQVSEPVESPFGYHLIQVTERKTDEVSQERLRMVARNAIRARKQDEAMMEWLRQLRDSTYVEYRLDQN